MKHKIIALLIFITIWITEASSQTGITARLIETETTIEGTTKSRFPGGEGTLYDYLIKNIRYPYILVQTEMEGDVDLKFSIDKEGKAENIAVLKGFDPLADDEIIRVIKNMPKWIPAESDGKPIDANFRLNIHFSLNDELKELAKQMKDTANEYSYVEHPIIAEYRMKTEELATAAKLPENSDIEPDKEQTQVDFSLNRSPEFPGGTNALEAYLKENMRYPKRAIKYGIEGRTIFNLLISPEGGEISKIWIFKSLFPDCDEEAFILIKKMPKWYPD